MTVVSADLIDWAAKAGTLPMQGLLLLGTIVLGWVIVYLHKQSSRKIDALHEENRVTQAEWERKTTAERAAMTQERRDRIDMLIGVVKEDTQIKAELKAAIDNNTKAIERLEDLLTKLIEKRK